MKQKQTQELYEKPVGIKYAHFRVIIQRPDAKRNVFYPACRKS